MVQPQHRLNPSPDDLEAERDNTSSEIVAPAEDTASGRSESRTAEETRQGHTGDHARYILAGSFVGVVVAFTAAYLFFFA